MLNSFSGHEALTTLTACPCIWLDCAYQSLLPNAARYLELTFSVRSIGWSNSTGAQQLGDDFRARRRLMNKMLGSGASGARSVVGVQEHAVRYLVRRVASGEVGLKEGIK